MVTTMMLISWMVSPCIHTSAYEFEKGYISPASSLSFLQKWGLGICFVIVYTADCRFKGFIRVQKVHTSTQHCSRIFSRWLSYFSEFSALLKQFLQLSTHSNECVGFFFGGGGCLSCASPRGLLSRSRIEQWLCVCGL
jgi:hypothetical protein